MHNEAASKREPDKTSSAFLDPGSSAGKRRCLKSWVLMRAYETLNSKFNLPTILTEIHSWDAAIDMGQDLIGDGSCPCG